MLFHRPVTLLHSRYEMQPQHGCKLLSGQYITLCYYPRVILPHFFRETKPKSLIHEGGRHLHKDKTQLLRELLHHQRLLSSFGLLLFYLFLFEWKTPPCHNVKIRYCFIERLPRLLIDNVDSLSQSQYRCACACMCLLYFCSTMNKIKYSGRLRQFFQRESQFFTCILTGNAIGE